jgi:transposase
MKKDVNHRDAQKERYWQDIIERQERSGESVRAYCRREGVTESAFYW